MNKEALIALRYAASIIACLGTSAHAANWTNSAGVAPAVVYTDNVCLEADNEQGEWVGTLTPDMTIRGEGSRANLDLKASVEVNSLSDSKLRNLGCDTRGLGGNREQFAPRLNASADSILIDNWLFIDSRANIYQTAVTPFFRGGGDPLDRTGNTNTTYRYSISPYVARRFKDVAELNLRYSYDEQYNTENVVGDSDEHRVGLVFASVPGISSFIWGIQGDYSKVTYSDTPGRPEDDSTLKSAQVNLGYQLDRVWQVNGFYGNEWNDFVSENDDIDGDYWDFGLRWVPNTRTTVDVGTGHRFYGDSPRFAIEHRHKRSVFSVNYSKQLSYDRDIRNQGADPLPGGDPGLSVLSNSPILDERLTLRYVYKGRRSEFGLSAFQSEQKREANLDDSRFQGIYASFKRSLSRQLSLSCGLRWNEQDPRGSPGEITNSAETWRATLGARHQLSQNTNLSFDYQYSDRQSDISFDDYKENRFTLTLRVGL